MRFDRCDICNYVEGFGADLINKNVSSKIVVTFNPEFNEHQCTACRSALTNTRNDYRIRSKKPYEEERKT